MTTIVSADHYFLSPSGEYMFNPAKLGEAHAACLRSFVSNIQDGGVRMPGVRKVTVLRGIPGSGKSTFCTTHPVGDVVVDNTGTTVAEVAPYVALALAYGIEVEVVTLTVHPEVAAKRCIHGVSLATCERMAWNLAKSTSDLPPWWKHREFLGGPDTDRWVEVPGRG